MPQYAPFKKYFKSPAKVETKSECLLYGKIFRAAKYDESSKKRVKFDKIAFVWNYHILCSLLVLAPDDIDEFLSQHRLKTPAQLKVTYEKMIENKLVWHSRNKIQYEINALFESLVLAEHEFPEPISYRNADVDSNVTGKYISLLEAANPTSSEPQALQPRIATPRDSDSGN